MSYFESLGMRDAALRALSGDAQQTLDAFIQSERHRMGRDPLGGKGGYVNPKISRSYHIDPEPQASRRGVENPHVDVNRLRPYRGRFGEDKKKYPLGDKLYDD